MSTLTRRHALLASAAAAVLPGGRAARAGAPLTLWGPPAAPSIILAQAIAGRHLGALGEGASLRIWRTPDEMRAGISSGAMSAVIVPTNVAANLHNRGLGIRLVNVMTDGLLYVVAPEGTATDIAGLRGKRVALPFRNDMPDLIFRRLLSAANLPETALAIETAGSPAEAAQLLLAGRVDAALLSEPSASAAILRAGMQNQQLARVVDCRQAWTALIGPASVPQAGLVVTDALAGQLGAERLARLQAGLVAALADVTRDPQGAAATSAGAFGLPAPVIAASIPHSHLAVRAASAARADLAALFDTLAAQDPRLIGGRQPGDAFYAL